MCRGLEFLLVAAVGLALLTAPSARAATIDFESFDLAGGLYLDVAETLNFNNVGGSGVNVTILGGADNRIYDVFQYGHDTAATGQALIDWPWPLGSNLAGTTILFDQPVSSFSLRAGDFGGDDDGLLTITAYDGSDTLLGTTSAGWPSNAYPPFLMLSWSASGIRKIVYTSGGAYAGSTFIDDLTFAPQGTSGPVIPAPGAILLGALGAGLVGWLRRNRAL